MTERDIPAAPDDAANAPTTARRGLTRVELIALALALVGGGGVMLAVLGSRGTTVANVAAAPAAATASPSAAPAATPPTMMTRSGPGWTPNNTRWVGNARKSVAFELPAYNKVGIWMREVRPLLVVRCTPAGTEVFVYTGSAATIEPQTEDHTVRYAFDEEAEVRELWPDSSEHDALFAPDGAAFARRLADVTSFRFGFTPHNAAPVTAHFHVSGLRDSLKGVEKTCAGRPARTKQP